MKYILFYRVRKLQLLYPDIYNFNQYEIFDTLSKLEKFVAKNKLLKSDILYLGEYKPLEFKITLNEGDK